MQNKTILILVVVFATLRMFGAAEYKQIATNSSTRETNEWITVVTTNISAEQTAITTVWRSKHKHGHLFPCSNVTEVQNHLTGRLFRYTTKTNPYGILGFRASMADEP